MKTIYLATGYSNGISSDGSTSLTFQRVYKAVTDAGWGVTFNWTTTPEVSDNKKLLAKCEMSGVTEADFLGLILPGGRGAHWECGAAAASGKPIVILAEREEDLFNDKGDYVCIFYNLPDVYVAKTLDQFVTSLNYLYKSYYGDDIEDVEM